MYAIRFRIRAERSGEIKLSKWHCTNSGYTTLCGRLVANSDHNEEDENLGVIDCGQCVRTMRNENIGSV